MNDDLDLTLYTDATELVEAASTEAMEAISIALLDKGFCHVALTGGTLGSDLSRSLLSKINKVSDLSGLHIWFSDERFEAIDSPLRNSLVVSQEIKNSTVTVHFVKAPTDGFTVADAAAAYESELAAVQMDICVLGLGPDAHVASLFPNHWSPSQESGKKAIAVVDSPKPPLQRVSFSMSFINASSEVWIIAAGEAKAQAVTQVLEADQTVPAGHVMAAQLTRLIVDTEAFFTE